MGAATNLGANMMVAGVYHHSRLRESLLGGVSRDLLDRMTIPGLMSHRAPSLLQRGKDRPKIA